MSAYKIIKLFGCPDVSSAGLEATALRQAAMPAATRHGVGKKSLAKGEVELKPRNGALQAIKAEAAVEAVMKLVNG
jgi:hypothetical protein